MDTFCSVAFSLSDTIFVIAQSVAISHRRRGYVDMAYRYVTTYLEAVPAAGRMPSGDTASLDSSNSTRIWEMQEIPRGTSYVEVRDIVYRVHSFASHCVHVKAPRT